MDTVINNQNSISVLGKATLLQAHAMGLVISEIPSTTMKLIVRSRQNWNDAKNRARTEMQRKKIDTAKKIDSFLKRIIQINLCTHPLYKSYIRKTLTGIYRDDAAINIAFRLKSDVGFRYKPTSIITWGGADHNDIDEITGNDVEIFFYDRNPTSTLNFLVRRAKVAEIDLLCAANKDDNKMWETRGGGRALLAYTLSRIAARKKNRRRKFDAVICHLVCGDDGCYPAKKSMEAMGFVSIRNCWFRDKTTGQSKRCPRKYYVLKDDAELIWQRKVANAVVWDKTIADMCPLITGTGKGPCK
jgi:hypothetical protein